MQEHQFPTSPPPTTTLPRWIGFKYNLGYCQMWFTGYFLMALPLISVLFSLPLALPGSHRFPSEKKNVFTSPLRGSYRDVKCCQNKRGSRKGGRRMKGRGQESQYDSLTTVMGKSTTSITIIQLQKMWPFTWVVAAESKGRLEIVQLGQEPNLPWNIFAWLLNQLLFIDNPDIS